MELKRHLPMSLTSFEKLLSFIMKSLEVHSAMVQLQGGVIIPEIALYWTLCYLVDGSYMDIFCWYIQTFILPCCMEDNVCNCLMSKPTNYVAGHQRIGCAKCSGVLLHKY